MVALASLSKEIQRCARVPVVSLDASPPRREKVLCVGMNYVDHCTEQNLPIPKEPVIFK
jgi:2-keto-4-pentenoate hydratase/2-oxohepta-3-ene-1,7-dioic acid hydratase in catechol pathway